MFDSLARLVPDEKPAPALSPFGRARHCERATDHERGHDGRTEGTLHRSAHTLSDSHGGVVAQVERANNRIEYSLEGRARTMDTLLHEWKSDLLRIWIPMVAGACMLIGLFGGIEIQGCRDAPAVTPSTTTAVPAAPPVAPQAPTKTPKAPRAQK
jgi:hypothetical protein